MASVELIPMRTTYDFVLRLQGIKRLKKWKDSHNLLINGNIFDISAKRMAHEVHLALRLMSKEDVKGSFSRPTRILTRVKIRPKINDVASPFETQTIFTFQDEFEQMHVCMENSEIDNFVDEKDCMEAEISLVVTPFDFRVGEVLQSRLKTEEKFVFEIQNYENIGPEGQTSQVLQLQEDKMIQVKGYLASAGGFACSVSCWSLSGCQSHEAQVILTLGSKSKETTSLAYVTQFHRLSTKTIFYLDFLRVMDYTFEGKVTIFIQVFT